MVWFLVRGLIREEGHWTPFKDSLKDAFPNDVVHCLDLPGNGKHIKDKSPAKMPAYGEHLEKEAAEFLKENNLEEETIGVIAISLGGMAILEWNRLYPQRIAKMVLINSSLKAFSPVHHRVKPSQWFNLILVALTCSIARRERRIIKIVSNNVEMREKYVENWIKIQQERPVKKANAIRQLKAALTHNFIKAESDTKYLVLGSTADRLVNSKCSVEIAKALGAKLELHNTAGHDIPLDDAPWIISHVKSL